MQIAQVIDSPVNDINYLNVEYFFNQIYLFFVEDKTGGGGIGFKSVISTLDVILYLLIFFFITVLAYTTIRMFEIRKKEHEHIHHEIHEYAHKQKIKEEKQYAESQISTNPRWITVLKYLQSENEADWRIAVLEADSMLEDLLDQLGFEGENLGDKLKSADQESFKNLSIAWEVHTIRNRLAHEGVDFPLSLREAKRVIALYEDIFRPYGFI